MSEIRKIIRDIQDRLDDFISLLDRIENKKQQTALEPLSFYQNMYGYVNDTGIEGLYSSPMEYYSGSIADIGDPVQNPYNGIYGLASLQNKNKINNRKKQLLKIIKNQ